MKRLLKILAIVVVLVLAGTYVIYALDYKGNYNSVAMVTVNVDESGAISLTDFAWDSTPTSPVQFWDLFRGSASDIGAGTFKVYWELNSSGSLSLTKITLLQLANGESKTLPKQFNNIAPGDAILKITVRDYNMGNVLYQKSYSVVIG